MKRDLKKIGKMCQQCVAGIGQQISNMNRTNINLQITNFNNIYKTEIEELSEKVQSKKSLKTSRPSRGLFTQKCNKQEKKRLKRDKSSNRVML